MFRVRVQTVEAQARLHFVGEGIRPRAVSRILKDAALKGLNKLIRATPRGLTGRTKKAWRVDKTPSGYTITNSNGRVVLFLDQGTRAHGPVRARFLFIALTKRAALYGWSPSLRRGRDYILVKRVRGIRALNFVRRETDRTREYAVQQMTQHVRRLARGRR